MRIVIAGPPKAGNVWLKCLLAAMYGLQPLGPNRSPTSATLEAFSEWVADNRFRDGVVFHLHYDFSEEMAAAILAVPAQIVTVVRDPYDTFVSTFYTIQKHGDDPKRKGRKAAILAGKEIDHPDVIAWLQRGGFRNNLVKGNQWLASGHTAEVRYEALIEDPIAELNRLAARIEPVAPERIAAAVEGCSADVMRQNSRTAGHVRVAKVGDSRGRLNADHLTVFRDQYADLIQSLGYEVRDPCSTARENDGA